MARLRDRLHYQMLRSPVAPVLKAGRSLTRRTEVARRRQLAGTLPVDAEAERLARELDRDGMVNLDSLIDPAALHALSNAALGKLAQGDRIQAAAPAGTSNKTFWQRLLDDELVDGRMPADSPYARFALQPRLLAMLARSFGTLPQLDYVLLTLSVPSERPLGQSQLWHRDHDDTRTVKVFTYLTDVVEDSDGPFTLIPGPQSDRVGYTLRSHLPDDYVFARLPENSRQAMFAPALTTFAVETSRCLHMGSRIGPGHRRLLYTATYTTYPKLSGQSPRAFLLGQDEDEIARAVLAPPMI
jgi:hypothetical protein